MTRRSHGSVYVDRSFASLTFVLNEQMRMPPDR